MIDIDLLLTLGATYKKVSRGEIIFREGGAALFYYQLVEGSIKWFNVDEEGKESIQHIVEPGECFGELPLFDGGPYAATAVAEEDSLLIRLHRPNFEHFLRECPDFHFKFSRLLVERLRFKFMLVKELSCHSPIHRITTLMDYLRTNKKNVCSSCRKLLLTRQQIASMTGLRVETVIRVMKDLEEQKMITIEKGKVYFSMI